MRPISRNLMVSLAVFLVIMFFYVIQRVTVMQLGYEMEDLKAKQKNLEQINKSLLIERAALASVERIEKIATSYLEMKRAEDEQVVLVRNDNGEGTGSKVSKTEPLEKDSFSQVKVVKYTGWRY